jgi:hypothetical protein
LTALEDNATTAEAVLTKRARVDRWGKLNLETSIGARFTNFQELFLTRILNAILNRIRIDY